VGARGRGKRRGQEAGVRGGGKRQEQEAGARAIPLSFFVAVLFVDLYI